MDDHTKPPFGEIDLTAVLGDKAPHYFFLEGEVRNCKNVHETVGKFLRGINVTADLSAESVVDQVSGARERLADATGDHSEAAWMVYLMRSVLLAGQAIHALQLLQDATREAANTRAASTHTMLDTAHPPLRHVSYQVRSLLEQNIHFIEPDETKATD